MENTGQTNEMTIQEAAAYSGFSEAKIRKLIRVGKIKAHDISAGEKRKHWRIYKDSFSSFLTGGVSNAY